MSDINYKIVVNEKDYKCIKNIALNEQRSINNFVQVMIDKYIKSFKLPEQKEQVEKPISVWLNRKQIDDLKQIAKYRNESVKKLLFNLVQKAIKKGDKLHEKQSNQGSERT